jgi:16S rRNA (uracil1498-N3)-methyltransferase
MALLKGEKFDLVVQKATELGVTSIVPVITRLADIRLRDESDAKKRVLRWQRIALEAAKQSGRAVVPEVQNPTMFASILTTPGSEQNRILFSEREGQSLTKLKGNLPPKASSLVALLGSEGGWTDEELNDARSAGWSIITLGGRTLRAETAAIAVTTLLQHIFGDLR